VDNLLFDNKLFDSGYLVDKSGERFMRLTDFTLSPTITGTNKNQKNICLCILHFA